MSQSILSVIVLICVGWNIHELSNDNFRWNPNLSTASMNHVDGFVVIVTSLTMIIDAPFCDGLVEVNDAKLDTMAD